jgi:hypothetical protein
MGLTRYLIAASDWSWTAKNTTDKAIGIFLLLHDLAPTIAEWFHRESWIIVLGFFWPIFAYLLARSGTLMRVLLQPYILLTGIHLVGWVAAQAILGPGGVVLFELFISVLRVTQLRQLLLSPACATRYHHESYVRHHILETEMENPYSEHDVIPLELVAPANLKNAIAFGLRQPWSIVGLLLVQLILWSVNALILGLHVVSLLIGILALNWKW